MNAKRYDHVMALVTGRPWAVLPEVLETVRAIMASRLAGESLTAEDVRERIEAARRDGGDRRGQRADGGVGILPLYGLLTPRADMMSELSGATSMESFRRDLRAMLADPDIASIVMDVDSPGGFVEGIPETAAELRRARDQKPIVAVANTYMASAAYYLASQASEVVASPSSYVGSIGVLALHQDLSAMYEKAGVKTTVIRAGKYKAEGNEYEPLSEDALAYRQQMIDEHYDMFVTDVAKGRGVRKSAVASGYGEGRVLLAGPALAAGMVDRIATLDETVARVLRTPPSAGRAVAEDSSEPAVMEAIAGPSFEFERELYERRAVR